MSIGENQNNSCKFCGEAIPVQSRRCPYCGSLAQKYTEQNQQQEETVIYKEVIRFPVETAVDINDSVSDNDRIQGSDIETTDEINNTSEITSAQEAVSEIINPTHVHGGVQVHEGVLNAQDADVQAMSNSKKVFITVISSVIPGLGQLIGVIISILFMNSANKDKKSFGTALMISSIVLFFFTFIFWFLILVSLATTF